MRIIKKIFRIKPVHDKVYINNMKNKERGFYKVVISNSRHDELSLKESNSGTDLFKECILVNFDNIEQKDFVNYRQEFIDLVENKKYTEGELREGINIFLQNTYNHICDFTNRNFQISLRAVIRKIGEPKEEIIRYQQLSA